MTREEIKKAMRDTKKEVVLKNLHKLLSLVEGYPEYEDCVGYAIEVLEQEPKTGHWISRWYAGLHFHVCSECNEEFSFDMETGISIDNYRYCPKCGADMRGTEE